MQRKVAIVLAVVVAALVAALWFASRGDGSWRGVGPRLAEPKPAAAPIELPNDPERATVRVESGKDTSEASPSAPLDIATPANSSKARLLAHYVDVDGVSRPNSSYLLVPLGEDGCFRPRNEWIERVSDSNGRVDERDLTPGTWRGWFAPTYCAPQSYDMQLAAGDNDLGELVFPTVIEAGEVRVALATDAEVSRINGTLSIRSLDGLSVDRWGFLHSAFAVRSIEAESNAASAFEHLPAGEYEVRLFPHDGQPFETTLARARVPGEPIVFRCRDDLRSSPLRVEWSDAQDATPIEEVHLFVFDPEALHVDSFRGALPALRTYGARDVRRWFATARNHAIVETKAPGLAEREDPSATLAGELERGFGALVIVRDGDELLRTPGIGFESGLRRERASPLEGVAILADGVVVALTDRDGLALVNLPLAPRRIDARLAGRCTVDSEGAGSDDATKAPAELATFWLATP